MALLFREIFKSLADEYGTPDGDGENGSSYDNKSEGLFEQEVGDVEFDVNDDINRERNGDDTRGSNGDNISGVSDDVVDPEIEKENYVNNENVHFNEIIATNEKENDKKKSRCYKLLPPCNCKRKCLEKIDEPRRKQIFDDFWKMPYNERKSWIFHNVEVTPTNRHRPRTNESSRNRTMTYHFVNGDGLKQQVCQLFFLRTLGYSTNTVLRVIFEHTGPSAIQPTRDKRGKHEPANKIAEDNMKLIHSHIYSHHHAISHYRREHAPNRLYLAPELSITSMYNDFEHKHRGICKIETYRKQIKALNISFTKLGTEECEKCIIFENHLKENKENNCDADCDICKEANTHREDARLARDAYVDDKKEPFNDSSPIFSVDMEKVIMLPRMPGVKQCIFTRRLIAYHMTFAPLGEKQQIKPYGIIWHEAIRGRKAVDVTSTFLR